MDELWDAVDGLKNWLDAAGTPADARVMKVGAEAGELFDAYLGVRGQEPRKGVTHAWDDVYDELGDVALSALVALATLTPDARAAFGRRVEFVQRRALTPSA